MALAEVMYRVLQCFDARLDLINRFRQHPKREQYQDRAANHDALSEARIPGLMRGPLNHGQGIHPAAMQPSTTR